MVVSGATGSTIGIAGTDDAVGLTGGTVNIDNSYDTVGVVGNQDHVSGLQNDAINVDGIYDSVMAGNSLVDYSGSVVGDTEDGSAVDGDGYYDNGAPDDGGDSGDLEAAGSKAGTTGAAKSGNAPTVSTIPNSAGNAQAAGERGSVGDRSRHRPHDHVRLHGRPAPEHCHRRRLGFAPFATRRRVAAVRDAGGADAALTGTHRAPRSTKVLPRARRLADAALRH